MDDTTSALATISIFQNSKITIGLIRLKFSGNIQHNVKQASFQLNRYIGLGEITNRLKLIGSLSCSISAQGTTGPIELKFSH